jgi:hypothetical protein
MPLAIDAEYVERVLDLLRDNPTNSELDELVEAYTTIGYYAAVAEGLASDAEARRKHAEAEAILDKRNEDPKASMVILESIATVRTFDLKRAENKAKANAKKLMNLLDSVEQAINAIKYIGRNGGEYKIG